MAGPSAARKSVLGLGPEESETKTPKAKSPNPNIRGEVGGKNKSVAPRPGCLRTPWLAMW